MVLAAELFSMRGGNRSCAGQRHRSRHRRSTSPDRPDCLPVDRDHVTAVEERLHHCCGNPGTDLCPHDKLLSSGLRVLLVSPPGSEGGRLQGSAEGEGQDPGCGQGAVVDGVQVERSLLFALTS